MLQRKESQHSFRDLNSLVTIDPPARNTVILSFLLFDRVCVGSHVCWTGGARVALWVVE